MDPIRADAGPRAHRASGVHSPGWRAAEPEHWFESQIYFRTFVDSLTAILIGCLAVVLASSIDDPVAYIAGVIAGWVASGLWAYFRVVESNRQLDVRLARGVRGLLQRMFRPR